jgi:hypothetical protein
MTRPASLPRLSSEFDDFLFAPIGVDGKGMLLSVLSALARLEVDPWQEAAKLARLPGPTAIQRLASLIGALPHDPSMPNDAGTIAVRLVALLPGRDGSKVRSPGTMPGTAVTIDLQAVMCMIISMAFMALALGSQYMAASRQPPAQLDGTRAAPAPDAAVPGPAPDSRP